MRVDVVCFGVLKDLLGPGRQSLELAEGDSVQALVTLLRQRADGPLWRSLAVAVNGEYAGASRTLTEGDEVALLPPVSGGHDAD